MVDRPRPSSATGRAGPRSPTSTPDTLGAAVADPRRHHPDPSRRAQLPRTAPPTRPKGRCQLHRPSRRHPQRDRRKTASATPTATPRSSRPPATPTKPTGGTCATPTSSSPGGRLTIPGTKDSNARTAPAPAAPQLRAVPGDTAPDAAATRNQARRPRTRDQPHRPPAPPPTSTRSRAPSPPARRSRDRAPDRPSTSAGPADDADARAVAARRPGRRTRPGRVLVDAAAPPPRRAVPPPTPRAHHRHPTAGPGPGGEDPRHRRRRPPQPTVELVDQALRRLAADRAARQPADAHRWPPSSSAAADLTLHLTRRRRPPRPLDRPRATAPGGPCPPTPTRPTSASWSPTSPPPTRCWSPSAPATPATRGCSTARTSTLTVTGDPTYGADFARYLAAEIACNPWSAGVTLRLRRQSPTEVAPINPDRIRAHTTGPDPAARGPGRRRQHHRPRRRPRRRRRHRPRAPGRRRHLAGPAAPARRHRTHPPPP